MLMNGHNPKNTPESLIGAGVDAHRQGDFDGAVAAAVWAYDLAEPGSVEQGHAARDAGARSLKLGFMGKAKEWLKTAYETHLANVSER